MSNWVPSILALVGSFCSGLCGVCLGKRMERKIVKERLKKEALAKRSAYRQDWVNDLRREMAGFYAIITQHLGTPSDCQKYVDALSLHMAMILFYLNPKEPIYDEIKTSMQRLLPGRSGVPAGNEEEIENFRVTSQRILKDEWERIKRELDGHE